MCVCVCVCMEHETYTQRLPAVHMLLLCTSDRVSSYCHVNISTYSRPYTRLYLDPVVLFPPRYFGCDPRNEKLTVLMNGAVARTLTLLCCLHSWLHYTVRRSVCCRIFKEFLRDLLTSYIRSWLTLEWCILVCLYFFYTADYPLNKGDSYLFRR